MRCCAILISVASCFAQVSSVVSLSNGVQVRIIGTPGSLTTTLEPASGNSFYRIFRDENSLVVFAYEIAVARTPDGTQFRVTARPAGSEFATRFPNADAGKPVPTLAEPLESRLLASGERFTVEIPHNPAASATLTDTVQIQVRQPGDPPRDDDAAPPQLRFSGLRVAMRTRVVIPAGGAVVSGRYVMFFLPGHGGYFFSAEPVNRRPFVRIGTVDGTRLSFTLDNETYECQANASILLKSERGEIWVYHDPDYRPSGNWTQTDPDDPREEFFTAASDSLNWWLP